MLQSRYIRIDVPEIPSTPMPMGVQQALVLWNDEQHKSMAIWRERLANSLDHAAELFEGMQARIVALEEKLSDIEQRLDDLERRVSNLENPNP